MEDKIDKIKQQLQSQGYKLTPQREATVRVLLENEEDHLSAEDVFMLVKEKAPEIGLATVYRTLELLSELHIVEKINFGDGVARYDLRTDTSKHHHHHMICVQCGSMDEIREDWLGSLEEKLEKEFNFAVIDHRLDFHGICYRCREKNNSEGNRTE
ncbi:Fur family transcriptional regulator, ferric uptake regulator [Paenibacillus sophorae]|uniref:Fur family transcriptional regulator, ferric uptake regulator n=1 Tax=Paenibacillus sophorae TaxID=1333845 RepID=A0A1H8NA36_9BACL|nr:Fur family transcriptional regulator [Paenibacillus sophorae]QWU18478.1 transcriptional repressor [Paenibacillus sophorae]SEO26309.1 Fur family transcriptional regulator, ferric uptake regulator [Paenibacillus sophorae]